MSHKSESIAHQGFIESIAEDFYKVKILAQSACGTCGSKHICGMGESQEKIIEISRHKTDNFQMGQQVNVILEKTLGFKALFYGYLLPLISMVVVLFIVAGFTGNEGLGGISALLSLAPYYGILWFFRSKLKHTFSFRMEAIS